LSIGVQILTELNHCITFSGKNKNVGLALSCVQLAVGKQKMPNPRAMAFIKRLATAALQVEHHESAAILSEIKHILKVKIFACRKLPLY